MIVAGAEHHGRNGLLSVVHRSVSLSKSSKVLSERGANEASKDDQDNNQILKKALTKARPNSLESIMKENCSICGSATKSTDNFCEKSAEDSHGNDKSLALVPVPKVEASSSSISKLIRQVPELKPGWPLLRRAILPDQQASDRSLVRQMSVVQWAMRLPSRQLSSSTANVYHKQNCCDQAKEQSNLDGESGAIVPVGMDTMTCPPSPGYNSKSLPKELDDLHEKYSATCRLFNYQELLSATSNFLAGLFHCTN